MATSESGIITPGLVDIIAQDDPRYELINARMSYSDRPGYLGDLELYLQPLWDAAEMRARLQQNYKESTDVQDVTLRRYDNIVEKVAITCGAMLFGITVAEAYASDYASVTVCALGGAAFFGMECDRIKRERKRK